MANSPSPLELASDRLNTIHTAIDALFKHTTKAVGIPTQADRTTFILTQKLPPLAKLMPKHASWCLMPSVAEARRGAPPGADVFFRFNLKSLYFVIYICTIILATHHTRFHEFYFLVIHHVCHGNRVPTCQTGRNMLRHLPLIVGSTTKC